MRIRPSSALVATFPTTVLTRMIGTFGTWKLAFGARKKFLFIPLSAITIFMAWLYLKRRPAAESECRRINAGRVFRVFAEKIGAKLVSDSEKAAGRQGEQMATEPGQPDVGREDDNPTTPTDT